jgi:hypothetical protein
MKKNKFIGWAQYTKEEFTKLTFTQKAGRLIFVRELDENGLCTHSQIYFGSRLYAEVNSDNTILNNIVSNIISSIGKNIAEDGSFIEFDIELHPIVGGKTNITEAIIALEIAINNLIERIVKIETCFEIDGNDL